MSVATMLLGKDVAAKIAKNKAGFLNMFKGSADDVVERAGKHFDYHSEKVGGPLTKDALNAMKQDVFDNISPGQGASMSNVAKGNILTESFNVTSGVGKSLLMGGVLGGLAAGATGGEVPEGAVIGALAGASIRGIGSGIAKNLEKKFMGDLLGDSAEKFSKQNVRTGGLTVGKMKNMTPSELKAAGVADDFDMNHLLTNEMSAKAPLSGFKDYDVKISDNVASHPESLTFKPDNTTFGVGNDAVNTTISVRQQQLSAIKGMDDAALDAAGSGARYKRDVLMGTKDLNVAQYTRLAGFGGSALIGSKFSSNKRDHRSGFNKHRGNRV